MVLFVGKYPKYIMCKKHKVYSVSCDECMKEKEKKTRVC